MFTLCRCALIGLLLAHSCHSQDVASNQSRDLHGDPLPPHAVARLGTSRLRHGSSVHNLRFSRDESLLTSTSNDTLYVWNPDSGQLVRSENIKGLMTLRLSSDQMLVGPNEKNLGDFVLWNLLDPTSHPPKPLDDPERRVIPGPKKRNLTYFKVLSPDARVLATVSHSSRGFEEIRLWKFQPKTNVSDMEPLDRKWRSRDAIIDLKFSGDGNRLIATSVIEEEIKVMAYGVVGDAGAQTIMVPRPTEFNGRALAVAYDGKSFATVLKDRKLRVYRFNSTEPTIAMEIPAVDNNDYKELITLCFSPDGKHLAGAGTENRIWIWDIRSGKIVHKLDGHQSWIETLDFSPDGKTLASGGQDNVARLWDVDKGMEKNVPASHRYWAFGCSFSHDGKTVATAGGDGTTRIWNATTGAQLRKIKHEKPWAVSCVFIPRSDLLATVDSAAIQLRDLDSGETQWQSPGTAHSYSSRISCSGDGQRFATSINQKNVCVWERSATARQLAKFTSTVDDKYTQVQTTCISPNGKTVAFSTSTNMAATTHVEFFDIENGELQRLVKIKKGGASSLCFTSDGKQFVSGGHSTRKGWSKNGRDLASPNLEDSVILWDVQTGKVVRKFGLPDGRKQAYRLVRDVKLTPDDKYLLTAEGDGRVIVYEVATGKFVHQYSGHFGTVFSLAVSPDQRHCVSVGADTTGLVWDLSILP